jgi:hypothetical protein
MDNDEAFAGCLFLGLFVVAVVVIVLIYRFIS